MHIKFENDVNVGKIDEKQKKYHKKALQSDDELGKISQNTFRCFATTVDR